MTAFLATVSAVLQSMGRKDTSQICWDTVKYHNKRFYKKDKFDIN